MGFLPTFSCAIFFIAFEQRLKYADLLKSRFLVLGLYQKQP